MFYKKILVLSIVCSNCDRKDNKIFKEERSVEILNNIDFV